MYVTVKKAYYKLSLPFHPRIKLFIVDCIESIGNRRCVCEIHVCTVKKSYYKLSLPFHPQIVGNKFITARKFQALGKVYDILSDVDKRRLYNREGLDSCDYLWSIILLYSFCVVIISRQLLVMSSKSYRNSASTPFVVSK